MANKLLCEVLLEKEQQCPNKVYLRQPREGQWHEYTWAQVMEKVRRVASFLKAQGFKKGQHVSIVSKNCAEWFITDFAIAMAGLVNVPLFANQHTDSIEYVLDHGEVEFIFMGKLDDPVRIRNDIPRTIKSASFDYHDDLETDFSWQDVMQSEPLKDLELPSGEDLYTIIYTSGTSGKPKGAMYSHETIAKYFALFEQDVHRLIDVHDAHLVSYLPLAHVYERTVIQLGSLFMDCDVSFVESLDTFAQNLTEIKPTAFAAVPRIWSVFKEKIEAKLPPHKLDLLLKIPLISSLIKKKIRSSLGLTRCKACFSGASHLPLNVSEFFERLGIKIQQGYGQTENLAYATACTKENWQNESVGNPRTGVEAKLGDNNELLLRSDCNMDGYFKDEKATSESFTEDGFLKTGDIAEIDEHHMVKIICRLSENFKNQKGEFISPVPIEQDFSRNNHIEQLALVGQGLAHNVMIVSLSQNAKSKAKNEVEESIHVTMQDVNQDLTSYEKISHVLIVNDEWTPDNGVLTPTMKIRRHSLEQRYSNLIDQVSNDEKAVHWQEQG
jgi:long-chain acyl-CoA synthetase